MKIFVFLVAVIQLQNVWGFINLDPMHELMASALYKAGGIVKYWELLKYGESMTEDTFPPGLPIDEEYDFIIAGASPAGCVLAARLSMDYKVLLLEPGKGEPAAGRVPINAAIMQMTPYNWDFEIKDDPMTGFGLRNRTMKWPRGKCLGGTSCINYMIYTRGNQYDFDKLGAKNPGWGWDEVLTHYKNIEQAMKIMYMEPNYHGLDGELSVSTGYYNELVQRFTSAGAEMGYEIGDYHGTNQTRFSPVQGTIKDGLRHSAGSAFLFPNRHRSNLHVRPLTTVSRVLIEEGVATGVEYYFDGNPYTVKATKEVILSAGVLVSPQILMLSGIGPKEDLEKLNIPVKRDCPVGKKLYDHLAYAGLSYLFDKPGISLNPFDFADPGNWKDLFLSQNSRLSSLGAVTALGYIKLHEDTPHSDFEIVVPYGSLISELGVSAKMLNINQTTYFGLWGPLLFQNPFQTGSFIPMQLYPKSYGYMKLKSNNIFDKPIYVPRYYSDPKGEDMADMIAAIRHTRQIVHTKAFQEIGGRNADIAVPGCGKYKYDSDNYWKCAVQSLSVSFWHQVATAKMGPADDPEAIVDSSGKVYGFQKLRVADASILPEPISAHTNAPCMMIGENIAQRILKEYAPTE